MTIFFPLWFLWLWIVLSLISTSLQVASFILRRRLEKLRRDMACDQPMVGEGIGREIVHTQGNAR